MSLKTLQRELAGLMEQHRREGWGWRYDGLESWPTEKIFDQLRQLGIDTDAERFHQQALTAARITVLDDDWDNQLSDENKNSGFWRDFPMMAIPVLWDRLASDVVCPELIDHHLHRVLESEEKNHELDDVDGLPAALAVAMELVRYLQGFTPAQRSAKFTEILEKSFYDYTDLLIELIEQHGAQFPDLATQLADVMSDCAQPESFQTELALSLALAGRREEAISRAQHLLQRFPDDLWVKILAGDVYEVLNDDTEAIRLWLEALPAAVESYDWDAVAERLEDPFEKSGRTAELADILRAHPRPKLVYTPQPVADIAPEFARPEPIIAAAKVGRNDPCPCGSGKKYKKCCLP